MGIGRLAVVALAMMVAFAGIGGAIGELTETDDREKAFQGIELRKDDGAGDEAVAAEPDDEGDGDSTRGDDGTRGGDNTGDGDRTRGNDGTSGGDNTGDGDYTAGNDGTAGGDNSYVAPSPAPYQGGGDASYDGGSGGSGGS